MTKVPITPLADYVVVVQEEAKNKTASGLYLPDNTGEKPKIAEILAVGPLVKDVKAGDKVIFGGYSNSEVKIDGVEYILVKNENIYAKLG
ncbi:MAG: co-chaperone GroES [Candidatus Saccharibacteria bacterium]|nr:co-chaperone GroES [Candidatus Saccharibacteria bacterium]